MSNEIATNEGTNSLGLNKKDLVAPTADETALANFGSGKSWLARMDLVGSGSNLAKEGKVNQGNYALVRDKNTIITLGNTVHCYVLALRLKALKFGGEKPEAHYDPKTEEFQKIAAMSEVKDSGCMAGPEFLLYIPNQKTFATFHMASISQQNESINVKALLGDAATLTIVLADNKKYKWHVTKTLPCTVPLVQPDRDEMNAQINKFKNPPKEEPKEEAPVAAENSRVQ